MKPNRYVDGIKICRGIDPRLAKAVDAAPHWFSERNKRFFDDVSYSLAYSKKGDRYMIRATYRWSDMLGGQRKLYYRINAINDDWTIGNLLDNEFDTKREALKFLTRGD